GTAHAVGVGNGLDALSLALQAKGIGHGDSVVVPVNSFIATALAVSRLGAQPIFVDVDEDTANIDACAAAAAIRPDTRAIIPVRTLANYGAEQKDRHVIQGANSPLDPIQPAVLSVKLRHLDSWNERRRILAERYRVGLSGLDGLILPSVRSWAQPNWHVFAIR